MISTLPATLFYWLAGRIKTVVVACCHTSRSERAIRCPWRRAGRERQFAALRDPDAIWRLGINRAHGPPGPAVMFDAVGAVRQRQRPIGDQFIRPEFFLPALLLRHRRRLCRCRRGLAF